VRSLPSSRADCCTTANNGYLMPLNLPLITRMLIVGLGTVSPK
jgi:hypothetical protein